MSLLWLCAVFSWCLSRSSKKLISSIHGREQESDINPLPTTKLTSINSAIVKSYSYSPLSSSIPPSHPPGFPFLPAPTSSSSNSHLLIHSDESNSFIYSINNDTTSGTNAMYLRFSFTDCLRWFRCHLPSFLDSWLRLAVQTQSVHRLGQTFLDIFSLLLQRPPFFNSHCWCPSFTHSSSFPCKIPPSFSYCCKIYPNWRILR